MALLFGLGAFVAVAALCYAVGLDYPDNGPAISCGDPTCDCHADEEEAP